MTVSAEAKHSLSIWTALKDLGWFFGLLTALVGGPSILQIVQYSYPTFQLTSFLRWLPESLHALQMFVAQVLQPWSATLVEWLNSRFGLSLNLQPIWLPVFSLSWVYVAARARISAQYVWWRTAVPQTIASFIAALCAALFVGVVASTDEWWVQGLAAGIPLLAVDLAGSIALVGATVGIPHSGTWRAFVRTTASATRFSLIAFVLGIGAYFVVGPAGGTCALGLLILFRGLQAISIGIGEAVPYNIRVGLTIVGAFVAAALITAADAALSLF